MGDGAAPRLSPETTAIRPVLSRPVVDAQIFEAARTNERMIAFVRLVAAGLIASVDLANHFDHGENFPMVTVGYAIVAGIIYFLLRQKFFSIWFPVIVPLVDVAAVVGASHFSLHEHGQDVFVQQGGMSNLALACGLLAVSGGLRLRPLITFETTVLGIVAYLMFAASSGFHAPDFIFVDISIITACGIFGQYTANFVRRSLHLERMLVSVFDASPVGLAVADATGHLIQVNAAFRQLFGYGSEMLVVDAQGRILRTAVPLTSKGHIPTHTASVSIVDIFADAEEAEHVRLALQTADLAGLERLSRRANWRTADGRRRLVNWSVSAVHLDHHQHSRGWGGHHRNGGRRGGSATRLENGRAGKNGGGSGARNRQSALRDHASRSPAACQRRSRGATPSAD